MIEEDDNNLNINDNIINDNNENHNNNDNDNNDKNDNVNNNINNNKNNNNNKIENEEEESDNTKDILKKIEDQMKMSQIVINKDIRSQSMYIPNTSKKIQNIIKINESEYIDIENKKPKNAIFDDFCSICSSPIYLNKYLCIICENCVLCENCEENHNHPVIKCKDNQFCKLNIIFKYISDNNLLIKTNENSTKKNFFSNLFSKQQTYEFKLSTNNTNFSMRCNKTIQIEIYLENLMNKEINLDDLNLVLIARNIRDLNIENTMIKGRISSKERITNIINIKTNNICKLYIFKMELYSISKNNIKIQSNSISFRIEVNEDDEEEELNDFFSGFHKILTQNKEMKKNIKDIMEQKICNVHPEMIMNYLIANNGNKEETIKDLQSFKETMN